MSAKPSTNMDPLSRLEQSAAEIKALALELTKTKN